MNSLTEENYLKEIFQLALNEKEKISTNLIADKLMLKAPTVSEMLKRLSEKNLIHYEKYQGVKLTEKGKKAALSIIRKHRLWEVFLVEKLKFKWSEVHDIAEQLEHIHSDELIDRLDKFLGFPKTDPHGDPIPDINGKFKAQVLKKLSELKQGAESRISGVADHSTSFLNHLEIIGISIRDEIKILEISQYDKSLHVQVNNRHKLFISSETAKNILVS